MRLKLKIGVLSLTLLLFSLILYSCVDEPYNEPAKRPFTEIKVLNLSHNLENIKVTIDDQTPVASLNTMARPSATEYFDVQGGKRIFKIYNDAGNLIFTKEIELLSYERMQIIFAGEWDADPLISTLADTKVYEGYVYVDHKPVAGTSTIAIVHVAAPYDTVTEREYTGLSGEVPGPDGTQIHKDFIVSTDNPLAYEDVYYIDSAYAGTYDLTFTSSGGSVTYSTSFTADKLGYIYLFGRPEAVEFFSYEITPPPARSK